MPSAEIAELCARLDSLPLAVELAAARLNVLSPRQILERLAQQLDLLKGGRDSDPRQQTLRATIEWSYGLLSEERTGPLAASLRLRRGLHARGRGGGGRLRPRHPAGARRESLLRHLNERYWMLDTIRAFALEYLGTRDDAESAFRRHAEWFVALTESSAHELFGSEQADWLSRLEREHDNLRAALTWAYDAGQVELALRLTAAMQPFLYKHGHIMEGRRWLERARLAPDPQPPELRARILQGAGVLRRHTRRLELGSGSGGGGPRALPAAR